MTQYSVYIMADTIVFLPLTTISKTEGKRYDEKSSGQREQKD